MRNAISLMSTPKDRRRRASSLSNIQMQTEKLLGCVHVLRPGWQTKNAPNYPHVTG